MHILSPSLITILLLALVKAQRNSRRLPGCDFRVSKDLPRLYYSRSSKRPPCKDQILLIPLEASTERQRFHRLIIIYMCVNPCQVYIPPKYATAVVSIGTEAWFIPAVTVPNVSQGMHCQLAMARKAKCDNEKKVYQGDR